MSAAVGTAGERVHPEPTIALVGVVDDDESVRNGFSSLLRSAGYSCAMYGSAEEFLSTQGIDAADCMLLDIRMPGLSGLELQRKLREMNFSTPIIFVTAHTDEGIRARALADGAVAFLGKPVDDEALLKALRSALNEAGH